MMNWRASIQRPILAPKQLLVEGRTAEIFFREWIEATGLNRIMQVRDFGSISNLPGYLRVFCKERGFLENVNCLGIIRDAETNPAVAAFQSVCHSLKAAELGCPETAGACSAGIPRIGIFILPDCAQPGMLETLCWQVLEAQATSTAQVRCVGAYLECLRACSQFRNEAKAKVWTFLAGRGEFDPLVGRAAQAGVWDWSSPALSQLSSFLSSL
jgi:hypothetical protein